MLPLRISTIETLRGHLLISYIATCAIRLMQVKLNTTDIFSSETLKELNNQKCIIYPHRIVTGTPQSKANSAYSICGIKCFDEIQLESGKAIYTNPKKDECYFGNIEKSLASDECGTAVPGEGTSASGEEGRRDAAPEAPVKRRRGRPKGSKNRATLEREAREAEEGKKAAAPKRGRGRPKGSKNKATIEREAKRQAEINAHSRRKPGRPKGSKNKKTLEREALEEAARQAEAQGHSG